MNKHIYFDCNVFDHIDKQIGVSKQDVEKLFRLTREDRIRIYMSVPLIEEVISVVIKNKKSAVRQLKLIRKLTKRKRMIRYHQFIAADDISCYIEGKKETSKFMSPPPELVKIICAPESCIPLMQRIANETQPMIQEYKNTMTANFELVKPLAKKIKHAGQKPTFEEYYEAMYEGYLERLIELMGLTNEIRDKGTKGLINVRTFQISTGAALSQVYSQSYDGRAQDRGDSRDMHHVTSSSAVSTFVTNDGRLCKTINKISVPNYEVIDLQTLLNRF